MDEFEIKHWYLRNHELFSGFADNDIKTLLPDFELFTLGKGSLIYPGNVPIDKIYLLLKGRVKIACRPEENPGVLIEILKEGDIFGELTLKQSENRQFEFAEVFICKGNNMFFYCREL